MAEPALVANCVKAMLDAVSIPVTVKHRIGIDRIESYSFVRDFVGSLADAGCRVFIVHARNAWLQGLSPKENREIPPPWYDMVYQLKKDFPHATIVLNGGVKTNEEIEQHLSQLDGVMLGRQAYHDPWLLTQWDHLFFGQPAFELDRTDIEARMVDYMEKTTRTTQEPWSRIARHMLGLRNGLSGARKWRQTWSDNHFHAMSPQQVSQQALAASAQVFTAPMN